MSAICDIAASYCRPKRVARKRLAVTSGEGHALMYLLFACLLAFAAQLPEMMRADILAESAAPFNGLAAARLLGVAVFAPLLFYFISASAALAFRAARKNLSWRDSRVSLFWALLAVAPAMLLLGILRGLTQSGLILWPTSALVGGLFLVFWAAGLSEAVSDRP